MEYLASPYTSSNPAVMERRFDQVMRVAAALIHEGRLIYSPILHFHTIAQAHDLPHDFDFWQEINKDVISHCSKLYVLKLSGWRESVGVTQEILFAKSLNIPVQELSPSPWLK